jgi:Flp pilus assembly pilin Flp
MLKKQASGFWCVVLCRRGAAMVEYALLAALLSLVASIALTTLGTNIKTMFTTLAGNV